jgi:alanyl-tRNA synthetase
MSLLSNGTQRLYYTDSYQTSFRANVTASGEGGRRLVLDCTAFYPSSGGQPHDTGTINGVALEDVIDDGDRVVHVLASPVSASEVEGAIDWPRRFDHMQQHTGQHLLSAVFADLFSIDTMSFHLGSESSTIDLACSSLTPDQLRAAELRANAIVQENRPVSVTNEDASVVTGLRKASERRGSLRVVSIEALDRSACGGTHVRGTGEIGVILLRSTEKIRGNVRLDFLCGARAVCRARADYDSLESSARLFSAPLDELPALVAAQAERLRSAEKTRKRLERELAEYRGRELYVRAAPNAAGLRIHSRILRGTGLPEDIRPEAMAFIAGEKSLFIAVSDSPASVLLASSADSGVHSGNSLKAILAEFSGKGGGAANMAQGSFVGDPERLLERLDAQLARE